MSEVTIPTKAHGAPEGCECAMPTNPPGEGGLQRYGSDKSY